MNSRDLAGRHFMLRKQYALLPETHLSIQRGAKASVEI